MKTLVRSGICAAALTGLVAFGAPSIAAAAPEAAAPAPAPAAKASLVDDPTPEQIADLQQELESQGYTPESSTSDGVLTKRYEIDTPDAPRVVVETTEPAPTPPGTITPYLHVGVGNGIYVYLNRADQNALLGGGSIALGSAICSIPAVGQAACGGVAAALGAASGYLMTNGICSNELEINYARFLDPLPRFKCV